MLGHRRAGADARRACSRVAGSPFRSAAGGGRELPDWSASPRQADGGAVMAAAVALPRRTDEGVILPPIIERFHLPMGTVEPAGT